MLNVHAVVSFAVLNFSGVYTCVPPFKRLPHK